MGYFVVYEIKNSFRITHPNPGWSEPCCSDDSSTTKMALNLSGIFEHCGCFKILIVLPVQEARQTKWQPAQEILHKTYLFIPKLVPLHPQWNVIRINFYQSCGKLARSLLFKVPKSKFYTSIKHDSCRYDEPMDKSR